MGQSRRARTSSAPVGKVVELFAGVGGFRLGLEAAGWDVIWANQWEPSSKAQHAFDCYVSHFDTGIHINEDINVVLDEIDAGRREDIPDHDLLVGGFPCQDYSVAKALAAARGIEGDKGALWWAIWRALKRRRPPLVLLENVDRLLKSPSSAPGRDFATILRSLAKLDYVVEWRLVNAADYGFPQRRRRVFLVAYQESPLEGTQTICAKEWVLRAGPLATALPLLTGGDSVLAGWDQPDLWIDRLSPEWFQRGRPNPFRGAGLMVGGAVWSVDVVPTYRGRRRVLGDVLEPDSAVPSGFFVPRRDIPKWRYLKGRKQEERLARNGHRYVYSEGAIPFPDLLDQPSRTLLTSEGGSSASRFRHVVRTESRRYRRLTPVELERLNGFPDGWTDTGMTDTQRGVMMGNALVVGLVERVGQTLRTLLRDSSRDVSGVA